MCDVAVMFVCFGAMVEQQLQQVGEFVQRATATNSFCLHRQPVWWRCEMWEAGLQQVVKRANIEPEGWDEWI